MFSTQIKQFLQIERLLSGSLGVLFGLLLSVLSDWLVQQQQVLIVWLLIAGMIIIAVILLVIRLRHPLKDIDVAIHSPLILRSDEQKRQYAHRGFVGFTPLYKPPRNSQAAKLSAEELKHAIENQQIEKLDIEQSNLFPTIQAILTHATKLEHCWLITTEGKNPEESTRPIADLLAKYLHEKAGLWQCKFHIYDMYTVRLDDDALVLRNTYDCVKRIFDQATRMGLAPHEIIADFSTGVRSMILGMILASLNRDRDIEFMGTHYDEKGFPRGDELFPIIFSFEPMPPSD